MRCDDDYTRTGGFNADNYVLLFLNTITGSLPPDWQLPTNVYFQDHPSHLDSDKRASGPVREAFRYADVLLAAHGPILELEPPSWRRRRGQDGRPRAGSRRPRKRQRHFSVLRNHIHSYRIEPDERGQGQDVRLHHEDLRLRDNVARNQERDDGNAQVSFQVQSSHDL